MSALWSTSLMLGRVQYLRVASSATTGAKALTAASSSTCCSIIASISAMSKGENGRD